MNLIKPKKLEKGDTIGILATSGAVESCENVCRAMKFFENLGYKVVLSEHAFDENRYLAGSDDTRVAELHKFFKSAEINAIICMRGGYGAIRMLDKIDWNIIKANPKIFAGYSDVSALSAMMLKHANLITFSAPLVQSDFGVEEPSDFTIKSFFDVVANNNDKKLVYYPQKQQIFYEGCAQGILFGGNLTTITSLCGQDFLPSEKFVFFVEELNEDVYKIDRMFTQLLNIKEFRKNISAMVVGDFMNADNEIWLNDLLTEVANELKVPTTGRFAITHRKDKLTIPYGAMCELDEKLTIYL